MHGLSPIDEGREIDWGRTPGNYAVYRPGFPPSFFKKLAATNIGSETSHARGSR